MLVGQFKTRRGAGGRLEKIPEAEQGELRAAAAGAPPLPPSDFIEQHRAQGAPPVVPPPLPSAPVTPPPLPPAPAAPPAPVQTEEAGVSGAVAGAQQGTRFGLAGAAIGGIAGFLASESQKPQAIGSFEGGTTTQSDESVGHLRDLLAVTKQTARLGLPVKGAITTNAKGSRL